MTAVVESECCRDKGSAELLLKAVWVEQPATEGAAQGTQVFIQGITGVLQDGPEFRHHPPLTHHLQGVQGEP